MGRSEMVQRGEEVGGIQLILGMIVNFPQDQLPKELAALAVNLTFNKANCQLMIQSKAVSKMVERYVNAKTKDSLLMKIIRNLSLFTFNFQQVGWALHADAVWECEDGVHDCAGVVSTACRRTPTTRTWTISTGDCGAHTSKTWCSNLPPATTTTSWWSYWAPWRTLRLLTYPPPRTGRSSSKNST